LIKSALCLAERFAAYLTIHEQSQGVGEPMDGVIRLILASRAGGVRRRNVTVARRTLRATDAQPWIQPFPDDRGRAK